jgi:hypothetical protein
VLIVERGWNSSIALRNRGRLGALSLNPDFEDERPAAHLTVLKVLLRRALGRIGRRLDPLPADRTIERHRDQHFSTLPNAVGSPLRSRSGE